MLNPFGIRAVASFMPAAAAYGAGDIISTAQEFAFVDFDGDSIPPGSLIRIVSSEIKNAVTAVPSGQTSFSLKTYLSAPATASQGDNDAWALAAADVSIYKGSLALGTPVDEGAGLFIYTAALDRDIKLTTSSLFGTYVTAAGFTAAATAHEVALYGFVLN